MKWARFELGLWHSVRLLQSTHLNRASATKWLVCPSTIIVSHGHTLFHEKAGVWSTYLTAVCCPTLYSAGPITAQHSVTWVRPITAQHAVTWVRPITAQYSVTSATNHSAVFCHMSATNHSTEYCTVIGPTLYSVHRKECCDRCETTVKPWVAATLPVFLR